MRKQKEEDLKDEEETKGRKPKPAVVGAKDSKHDLPGEKG
jgi:hypothetical protein